MENLLQSDQRIQLHTNQENPKSIPADKLTFSFGNRHQLKLCRELSSSEEVIRFKVLKTLVEELKDPQKAAEALQTEILTQLIICIHNSRPVQMKRDASECLIYISKIQKGKILIFDLEFIGNLFNLLFDTDEQVKVHGYEILLGITQEYLGREKVANDIIIKRLVEFLATENDNIKKYALHLLSNLMKAKVGIKLFLINDGIPKTKQLLFHADQQIVYRAIHLQEKLSMPDEGKKDLLKNKCVQPICSLLNHEHKAVIRETLKALAFLARENEAKFIIVGNETVNQHTQFTKQSIMQVEPNKDNQLEKIGRNLLEDKDIELLINAVVAVEMISYHPIARDQFKGKYKAVIESLEQSPIGTQEQASLLKTVSQKALKVINWMPGEFDKNNKDK